MGSIIDRYGFGTRSGGLVNFSKRSGGRYSGKFSSEADIFIGAFVNSRTTKIRKRCIWIAGGV